MSTKIHVCPWWMGYLLASPIRRWLTNPKRLLEPYVQAGMTALDVGCAMGFFSLPMGELVGPAGRVHCVDLQERMIRSLEKRVRRAGLGDRMSCRVCSAQSLEVDDLTGTVDFALAAAVIHEVPDKPGLMRQVHQALKPGAKFLAAEPSGHVKIDAFEQTVQQIKAAGFKEIERPKVRRSHAALLPRRGDRGYLQLIVFACSEGRSLRGPVFHFQLGDAAELTGVVRHEDAIARRCGRCDDEVVGTYGLSLCFQIRTDPGILQGLCLVEARGLEGK